MTTVTTTNNPKPLKVITLTNASWTRIRKTCKELSAQYPDAEIHDATLDLDLGRHTVIRIIPIQK